MHVKSCQQIKVLTPEDVVAARQLARKSSMLLGFSIVDQTKIVTASSELARNLLDHGGGGSVTLEVVENGARIGMRVTFEDQGPGIPDIEAALKDGFTTGHGLGLGLGGSKRLSHEFEIESAPGQGTRIAIVRWKSP